MGATKSLKKSLDDAKRVLIIDDTPTDMANTYHLASTLGYDVTICFNGEDALACLRKERFDLIILDLSMPILNGVDFLQRLGAESSLRENFYQLVIHSGFTDISWSLYLPKNVTLMDTWQKPISTKEIFKRLKLINL
jgi:CheY-like chemotaxis protein